MNFSASVIISVYNNIEALRLVLKSLELQSVTDFEVIIADDGEFLIIGPKVLHGYYKDPDKSASVMTEYYFHTGDKG